jgi:hypothetical protein
VLGSNVQKPNDNNNELRLHSNLNASKCCCCTILNHLFCQRFSQEQKAAKTLGIVMSVFIFCWLPFFLFQTFFVAFLSRIYPFENQDLIFSIFTWLGYINSGCNPIIYAFSSKDFRRAFYKILSAFTLIKKIFGLFTSKSKLN